MIKINCKWNDEGAWCKNKKVKRSLFGLGAICCIEYGTNKICSVRTSYPKPIKLPPCPPKKIVPEILIINQWR